MKPMRCISCKEEIKTAIVNRQLHKHRILLYCGSCAKALMHDDNWAEATGLVWTQGRVVVCIGCDRQVSHIHICTPLPQVMGFCGKCRSKLTREVLWDQCTRGGEDLSGYAPSTIVDGQTTGGH